MYVLVGVMVEVAVGVSEGDCVGVAGTVVDVCVGVLLGAWHGSVVALALLLRDSP